MVIVLLLLNFKRLMKPTQVTLMVESPKIHICMCTTSPCINPRDVFVEFIRLILPFCLSTKYSFHLKQLQEDEVNNENTFKCLQTLIFGFVIGIWMFQYELVNTWLIEYVVEVLRMVLCLKSYVNDSFFNTEVLLLLCRIGFLSFFSKTYVTEVSTHIDIQQLVVHGILFIALGVQ